MSAGLESFQFGPAWVCLSFVGIFGAITFPLVTAFVFVVGCGIAFLRKFAPVPEAAG